MECVVTVSWSRLFKAPLCTNAKEKASEATAKEQKKGQKKLKNRGRKG